MRRAGHLKDMSSIETFTFQRSTDSSSDPNTFTQRVNVSAAMATKKGHAALFAHRTASRFTGYYSMNAAAAGRSSGGGAGLELAQAFGSKVVADAELPGEMAESSAIATMRVASDEPGTSTQYGADPQEMARALSNSLPEDAWVGVSFRSSTPAERRNSRRYIEHRLGSKNPTHNSLRKDAVVLSVYAGAESMSEAKSVLDSLPSMMPGFDSDTKPVAVRRAPIWAWPLMLLGLVLLTVWVIGFPWFHDLFTADQVDAVTDRFLIPGVGLTLLGTAGVAGLIGSPVKKVRRALRRSMLPAPPRSPALVSKPREGRWVNTRDNDGTMNQSYKKPKNGSYPLNKSCFLFEATTFASMANPNGSSLAGAAVSSDRNVTPELAEAAGPVIGQVGETDVPIPAESLKFGLMVYGEPRSGKTVLLQGVWSWYCKERVEPSGLPGHPGENNTLIAFETKGGGEEGYLAHAGSRGDKALLIDALDASTPIIDPFAFPGTPAAKADRTVSAYEYAFTDGSVQDRSKESLAAVYQAAFTIDKHRVIDHVWTGGDDTLRLFDREGITVHDYAHALLMGSGADAFDDLMDSLVTRGKNLGDDGKEDVAEEIADAVDVMRPIAEKSASARQTHTDAPRNKVNQIRNMRFWFDPDRKVRTFDQVLTEHRSIIINTGPSNRVDGEMDEGQTRLLTALLMYSLNRAIIRNCRDWAADGRYVSLFADELAMLAGSNDEVITGLRDQGAAFGVRLHFGSQFPEGLSPRLAKNLNSYYTVGSFKIPAVDSAETVARQFGNEVSAEELRSMAKYHVAMQTNVNSEVQPPVTVRAHNFNTDIGED